MNELKLAAEKIRSADAVLIGASNGLSISEGLHLFADNRAFDDLFGDFKKKYGLQCLLAWNDGTLAFGRREVGLLEPGNPSLLPGIPAYRSHERSESHR